jgi:chromate transporter
MAAPELTTPSRARSLWDVAAVFLKIGLTAFGGPAAHIAMMHDEIVERRKWIDDQHFLDLLGATNLIPGPNSSEMSMHIGYVRGGLIGLIIGGMCFLLPSMVIVLGIAWAYVEYGSTPAAGWLLDGIKPVIIPLIIAALWSLGQKAVKGALTGFIGIAALVLYFFGINFVILLLGGGLAVMLVKNAPRLKEASWLRLLLPVIGLPAAAEAATGFSMWKMFLSFVKVGLLMYGSGYTLFAYLHADLVESTRWLTEKQLIDAIAAGQMTPGPLSTSATFIGYLLGGVPGAIIATFGIYIPAFVVVALSNPLIPRIRHSPWASGFLDGVNVAALGLMAAVTWELAQAAFPDLFAVVIGLVAAFMLFRYRVNSVYLVLFGALLGLLRAAV